MCATEAACDGSVKPSASGEKRHRPAVMACVCDRGGPRTSRQPKPCARIRSSGGGQAWRVGAAAWVDRQVHRPDGVSLVVTVPSDGRTIGKVALGHHDAAARRAELSYWLVSEARGRGLAGRAGHVLAAWGFEVARARSHRPRHRGGQHRLAGGGAPPRRRAAQRAASRGNRSMRRAPSTRPPGAPTADLITRGHPARGSACGMP